MEERINTLQQIYATLCEVTTKGNDSIYMGTALVTLQKIIEEMMTENNNDKAEPEQEK